MRDGIWDYVELQCEEPQASSCLNVTDDKIEVCVQKQKPAILHAGFVGESVRLVSGIANRDSMLRKVSSSPIIKPNFD